jgi:serine phosphatase RsbU (regulator of sigma subunit)/Tfp pilus assembly protein PilF
MHHRFFSAILIAFLAVFCYPDIILGQSTDSLLYLIDNELVKDDLEKYEILCQVISELFDAESKIRYSDQAIELAEKLDILPALPYLTKGEGYLDFDYLAVDSDIVQNRAKALECFIQAANYAEQNDERDYLGRAYLLMAETYNSQGHSDNEVHYLEQAMEVFESEKDTFNLAYAMHNMGYHNYSLGQYDTAMDIYNESLDLFRSSTHPYAEYAYYYCLGNMGLVYSKLSDLQKAEEYLLTAIDTLAGYGDMRAVAEFSNGYANVLLQKGEIEQAIAYAYGALNMTDIPNYDRDASLLLSKLYKISGNIDSAYYYQSIFIVANDRIKSIESVQSMADLRFEYEVGKKQAEVDVLEKIKLRNNMIIIGLVIILILAIWLVTMYYTNLKRSRKLTVALEERRILLENQSSELKEKNNKIIRANEELTSLNESISKQNAQIVEANEELTVLNEAISKQNSEIRDSISYAQRIQAAMMPPEQYFHEVLNDVFILFKPRDIVSGDFFWIKQVKQYVILAAADCTGHGVPGAFMSLLGISFLNEIVQRREITQANQVLNELRRQIRNSLRQHGQAEESKDGIDMALCVIDEKNNTLQYSGANNPLYLIRDQNGAPELTEFKADRMPLGYYQGTFKTFANQDIQLEYGDVFYLFSDGFVDQKGGKDNKKFMSRKFKNLLLKIHQEPMQEQKKILDKTINDWMGDHSQIDDILVIGVRV